MAIGLAALIRWNGASAVRSGNMLAVADKYLNLMQSTGSVV